MKNRTSTTRSLRHARIGLAIGTLAGAALFSASAHACDSCNYSFQSEILNGRADTLVGKDILAAMENQAGLPLEGLSNVQFGTPDEMRRKFAGEDSWGTVHAKEALYGDDDFIEIIKRDYALPVAPTSYVPQDATPDKSFTIEVGEGKVYMGNGVVYDGFYMNGKIPGPTLIMDEGDIVSMTIVNKGTVAHGSSIHAAYTQTSKYVGNVLPGESKTVVFRATHPGVFMYHCAPGGHAIPMHVIFGQYGMMVVKPKKTKYKMEELLGHAPDAEIYLVQHEWYASGKDGIEGNALYTTFNGKLFRYIEEPIKVKPGDYVRIHFLNVGPNLLSTFHIVGILWDYAYWQGHPDAFQAGGQSVTAGPADSWVVEFRMPPDEGTYLMLNHAVGGTSRGAIGALVADRNAITPVVVTADGPEYTQEEMVEITANATRIISPFTLGTPDVDPIAMHGPDEKQVTVRIIGNSFYPKAVQVTPGTTITWINEDVFSYMAGEFAGIHNAVGISGPESFVSPLLAHAETFSFTFEKEGEHDYMCTPHPYMRGKVIVAGAPAKTIETASANGVPIWLASLMALGLIAASVGLVRRGKN